MTLISADMSELEKLISSPNIKNVQKFSDIFPGNGPTPSSPGFCGLYLKNDTAIIVTGTTLKDLLDNYFNYKILV